MQKRHKIKEIIKEIFKKNIKLKEILWCFFIININRVINYLMPLSYRVESFSDLSPKVSFGYWNSTGRAGLCSLLGLIALKSSWASLGFHILILLMEVGAFTWVQHFDL